MTCREHPSVEIEPTLESVGSIERSTRENKKRSAAISKDETAREREALWILLVSDSVDIFLFSFWSRVK
jgi:hypothetical protein